MYAIMNTLDQGDSSRNAQSQQPSPRDGLSQSLALRTALHLYWLPFLLGVVVLGITYHQVVTAMVRDWSVDDNASHGFFIPLISGYLVWMRRSALAAAPVGESKVGLGLAAGAAAMLVAGWLAAEFFTMRLSLVLALCGCVLFWLGKDVFSRLLTPLLFLIFMIPIPAIVYDTVALPLKLFVSWFSVGVLKALGMMVVREGNVIMFPNITLEVVDACSGLRSLTSLLALATAYALIFVRRPWQRLVLVISAIPIAVGANVVRVVGTGILARRFGAAAAEGFFHEFTGLATFALALVMLVCLHQILRRFK
jgi:exosortase